MWPFSFKKKVPKVPFPEGRLDEGSLRFPRHAPLEKVIGPEKVQEAAGINKKEMLPETEELAFEESPMEEVTPMGLPSFQPQVSEPLFIKKEVYQRMLEELESLCGDLLNLNELNTDLEKSEFNEENNFALLRKYVKSMHDRLLQADKVLFKS